MRKSAYAIALLVMVSFARITISNPHKFLPVPRCTSCAHSQISTSHQVNKGTFADIAQVEESTISDAQTNKLTKTKPQNRNNIEESIKIPHYRILSGVSNAKSVIM